MFFQRVIRASPNQQLNDSVMCKCLQLGSSPAQSSAAPCRALSFLLFPFYNIHFGGLRFICFADFEVFIFLCNFHFNFVRNLRQFLFSFSSFFLLPLSLALSLKLSARVSWLWRCGNWVWELWWVKYQSILYRCVCVPVCECELRGSSHSHAYANLVSCRLCLLVVVGSSLASLECSQTREKGANWIL